MTDELAARWANTVVPSWIYRWFLPAAWIGAVVVSIVSDTGSGLCSPDDPSICGPDRAFAIAMVACFGSVLLLWWQPAVAAACGVLFLLLELQYDDLAGARLAWTVYGALCVALLVAMVISRQGQRSLTEDLLRRQVMVPAAAPVRVTVRLLVAGALVLVGVGALLAMHWQEQRESDHLRRAVEQTAIVDGTTEDEELILRLPDGTKRTIGMLDDYDTGTGIPVLVDPSDADWVRPRAEPADYTDWYTLAGGAWVLAVLLVARDLRRRRARPSRSWTAHGLPVRIEPDSSTAFAIWSVDDAVLLGFLVAEADDEETDARLYDAFDVLGEDQAPAALKRQWMQTLRRYRGDALLVGDLVEGSWPSIVVGDQVLRPVAPFRAPRRLPWRVESVSSSLRQVDAEVPRHSAPAVTIEPALAMPTLPWEVPLQARPWWERPALIALPVVAPIVVGAVAIFGEWVTAVAIAVVGGNALHALGARFFYRVIATTGEIRIRHGWSEQVKPWRAVDAVEIDEDRLNVETGDGWHVLAGIEPNQLMTTASIFETLRLRGRNGLPTADASRRLAPIALLDGAYLIVCVLVLVLARL